jgi:flagellar hook-associated protein 1 FlgK
LAGFLDAPLESQNGQSLSDLQERLATETSQATALARSVTDGFRVYHDSLEGRQMALGGVSIDEEVIRLITFQRSFQAAARFVSVVSEVLNDLVHL